jgi:hypothetical protein
MEAMQYRALTKTIERNIKEFIMHNVRGFGTCIGEESKHMHTTVKMIHKCTQSIIT